MDEINDEEIVETDDEGGEPARVDKLKEKLKVCEAERGQYLDGWQRTKADYANLKRESAERESKMEKEASARMVRELISVLESMDQARAHTKDLVPIENQLVAILKKHGLELVGKVGEKFDPMLHEAIGTVAVDEETSDHIIMELVSTGYALAGRTLKPARVRVGEYKNNN